MGAEPPATGRFFVLFWKIKLWIEGPAFLVEGQEDVKSLSPASVVRLALC